MKTTTNLRKIVDRYARENKCSLREAEEIVIKVLRAAGRW